MSRAVLAVVVTAASIAALDGPTDSLTAIQLDQVGYPSAAPKVAMVVSTAASGAFSVVRATDNASVLTGTLGAAIRDADSGDLLRPADFSSLTADGTYWLDVAGLGRSYPFTVGSDPYHRAYYLAARSFYGQRCGTAVDLGPEFPGYKHAACHLNGEFHPSSGKSGPHPSEGGWHDAGDYGRYVVNSGIATSTLLLTYQQFARRVRGLSLDIPESKNTTPDLLDEARWNLDWMLSMQDDDGGAWQKQTSEGFAAFVAPEDDKSVSYVIGSGHEPFKTTCATADLAATAAIASRVFREFDAAYADRTLAAAKKAYEWAERHPNELFKNPPGVSTGEYGDGNCSDERFWAAAELWMTTGMAVYDRYVTTHYDEFLTSLRPVGPQGWGSVAPLGLWSYALGVGGKPTVVDAIKEATIAAADAIVTRTESNGYRVSLARKDYVWGSNAVAANYAMELLLADRMRHDPRYVNAALDNLHYLLGRNALGRSFVTQVGANPIQFPHHRPSAADHNVLPWPGLLSGGPNWQRQDPAMRKLPDLPPARMFLDEQASYATNEIAINWNAPLVFLLASTLPQN
jgi:endoglucanase